MTFTPVPAIAAIIAEGSFETPPSTFADTVALLSQSTRMMGHTTSTSITQTRATIAAITSPSQSGIAGTAAIMLTRRMPMNMPSGDTLSMPIVTGLEAVCGLALM
jgi:hypothetical protein